MIGDEGEDEEEEEAEIIFFLERLYADFVCFERLIIDLRFRFIEDEFDTDAFVTDERAPANDGSLTLLTSRIRSNAYPLIVLFESANLYTFLEMVETSSTFGSIEPSSYLTI